MADHLAVPTDETRHTISGVCRYCDRPIHQDALRGWKHNPTSKQEVRRIRAQQIDIMTKALFSLWQCAPEQRLGQLITNIMNNTSGPDLFYVSDAEMIQLIHRYGQEVVQSWEKAS